MASTDNTSDDPLSEPSSHGPPADLDYEIVRPIGKGGYGEVWLVRDTQGEYRACKVVYRESFNHDRPYEREYEGIRKFEPVSRASQSQVKILYVGRRDAAGYFFYIMELADDAIGGTVARPETYAPKTLGSELERRGRLPVQECIELGVSLTAALENLHEHGLIHRDVKPANIIFVKGIPKLADIGLVTDADVTVSYVGTSGFIPPEGPGSPQADLYALGKSLYEISTGKDRLDYPELPANYGELPDHAALLEFNSVLVKACEANAAKRYASASEMRVDLMLLQSGKSVRQIRLSKRRWAMAAKLAAALCVALLLAMGGVYFTGHRTPTAESPRSKTSLPDPAELAASESKIRAACRTQLANGTSADRQRAAFELLERGSTEKDPATQLASLNVASLLATKAGNFSLAMQVCDKIAACFPINSLPAKADLLAQACREEQIAAKRPELAGLCIKTGFEAVAGDNYKIATTLAELAKISAQNSGDSRLVQEAGFLDRETVRCQAGFEQARPFEEILRINPGDPEGSLAVGKFLCFVKNNWEIGLPLMARATNEALKSILVAELDQKPKSPQDEIALANSWGNLAGAAAGEDRIRYYERARYWSLKAITATKEPEKTRLRQRLNQWLLAAPTEPGEIHIYSRVAGTEIIDIYGDEVRWQSGRGAINSRINEVALGDFKAGDLTIVKNSGATRMLPEAVDFSSARLIINRKPKNRGEAKLEPRSDHARVIIARQRSGYMEVDVTVTFGSKP